MTTAPVRFGVFEWDPGSHELRKHGLTLSVPNQSLTILVLLLDRPGGIVTRDQIQAQLWPDGTVVEFEHSISVAVARLRTALSDSAAAPRFIETVPGKGYRFLAAVERTGGDAAQIVPSFHHSMRRSRWVLGSVLVAGGLAVLAAVYVGTVRPSDNKGRFASIAVLPLANLSSDPEQEYLADGVTEELITQLSQISSLQVVSRTSVMRFKGRTGPVRQIARELGVESVLEGSVQRSRDRVRVTVQLIDASTDRHVWSKVFEREAADVLSVRGDIAVAVAKELRIALTPFERTRFARPSTINGAAYDAYLKGRYFAARSDTKGQTKAVEYFEESVRSDPQFAPAWAALAHAIGYLNFWDDVPPSERCTYAMRRALELDPTLPEAHVNLGDVKFYWAWDWNAGEAAFRRAVELNPASVDALDHYALCLRVLGRACEAVEPAERALRLDPLSPSMNVGVGFALLGCGRLEAAVDKFKMAAALDPSYQPAYTALAETYEQLGKTDEAVAEYLKRERIAGRGDEARLDLEEVYRAGGLVAFKRRLAEERLRTLQGISKTRRVSPRAFAEVYVGKGEFPEALRWLEEAFRQRCPGLALLKTAPRWAPLRGHPQFQDLLRRMSLE